jgi:transcriptional regulator with XRE-family HTH domain
MLWSTKGDVKVTEVGEFIRMQRRLAQLSLRQLSQLADVSDAYLSQVERGLYRPSAQVLKNLADALQVSAETLYRRAGLLEDADDSAPAGVEETILLDERLSDEQKEALLRVYRSFLS